MGTTGKYSFYVEDKALEVAERPRKFLEAFAGILEHSSYGLALDVYTRLSTKCSRCAAACQLYQTTGDDQDIPCHRSEMLLKIFRRYFTRTGVLKARLFGGFELTDEYLDELAEAVYRCTACRRCKSTCPMGIDHGLITHLTRWILSEIDLIPKALVVATREQLEGVGNTSAIPVPALKDTLEFLEEEFEDIYDRDDIKFPIDVEGAEYLYPIVQPSLRAVIIDFHPLPKRNWIEAARRIIQELEDAGFTSVVEPDFTNGWTRAGSWMRLMETEGACKSLMNGEQCCGCGKKIRATSKALCQDCWAAWSEKDRTGFERGRS